MEQNSTIYLFSKSYTFFKHKYVVSFVFWEYVDEGSGKYMLWKGGAPWALPVNFGPYVLETMWFKQTFECSSHPQFSTDFLPSCGEGYLLKCPSLRGQGFAQPWGWESFCQVLVFGSFHVYSLGLRRNHLANTEKSSCMWCHGFRLTEDNPVLPHSPTVRSFGLLRSEQGTLWKATKNDFRDVVCPTGKK